jgi:EAL domain-containing protein (putative c-di-GMP-specific phosphodiesterase class I)
MTGKTRLREALSTPGGLDEAFELLAQPIVDLRSDRVSHYELLLRLRGEGDELIAPGEWAPAVRALGGEAQLDNWVAARAVLMLRPGPDSEEPQLEVNLSRKTILDNSFSTQLSAALEARGVSPDALVVEVDAGGTVAPSEMSGFARRRFRLAHHFSAISLEQHGFSEVSQLNSMPYDYLKIDGEFIRELPNSPADQGIVRRLGHIVSRIGKRTIALHVEDRETVALLKEAGIDYGQGYFFGKPERLKASHRAVA